MSAEGAPRIIDITATPGFSTWLEQTGGSLAFTSYRSGELFTLGLSPMGGLSVSNCGLERCMGLGIGATGLWAAAAYQLWRFENILPQGTRYKDHDAVFVPLTAHTTGEIDIHDIAEMPDSTPLFIATRFNCLARLTPGHSFAAAWAPPFIDRIIAEDRCHLNGFALRDGEPFVATAIGISNASGGWRDHRRGGGIVIDIASNEIIASGLSMPHSPRWHDGKIWLHQSGTGEFGLLDPATGQFQALCYLPGFLRGIGFVGKWAVVGLSRPRAASGFDDLPLQDRLTSQGQMADCAVYVIDLTSGAIAHRVTIGPGVDEIYDVAILPGLRNPYLVRTVGDDIRYLLRPLDERAAIAASRQA